MKLEDVMLFTKGWCITTSTMSSGFAAGLTQLKMETVWGVNINLLALVCMTYSAGATAMLGFLSNSFGDYMNKRSSGNTQFFTNPNPPAKPPP